mgnify:CR=1 FL=1
MNDILKAALQTQYGISRSEAIERIDEAKNKGKLLELYECAMLKLELEAKKNV